MAVVSERRKAPEAEFYTWSFPGSPVRIRLDLAVVKSFSARLRHGAAAAECGVLIGSVEGSTTVISGTQPIAQPAVADAARAIASVGAKAVGYYRLTEEDSLRLNESDLALAEALFRDPHQVFLLVHRGGAGPASATFYFRDNGLLNGDFPFLEFPFDAALLAQAEKHRAEMAQRRIEQPAAPIVAAPPKPAAPAPGRPVSWKPIVWTFVTASLLLAAGGVLWRTRTAFSNAPAAPASAPATAEHSAQSAIGLQVLRQNEDFKVTWDRGSALVANANSGVLSIQDGNTQRVIPLSAGQVREGSIVYSPMSDRVQMWLTISGTGNTAIESVIVVNPRIGAPQTAPPPRTVAQPQEAERVEPKILYLKRFTAPQGKQLRPGSQTAALDEPPRLAAAVAVAAVPAPLLRPALPAFPSAAPSSKPIQNSSPYSPPVAIRQVTPTSPVSFEALVLRPQSVEVLVSIDTNGKVVKAEPSPEKGVHQLVVHAAVAAARQWRFRPARRGDQPVPSEMVLRFNFKPAF